MASLEQERDEARAELAAKARDLADKTLVVAELQEQQRIDSSEAHVLKSEVKSQQEQVTSRTLALRVGSGSPYQRIFRSRP